MVFPPGIWKILLGDGVVCEKAMYRVISELGVGEFESLAETEGSDLLPVIPSPTPASSSASNPPPPQQLAGPVLPPGSAFVLEASAGGERHQVPTVSLS